MCLPCVNKKFIKQLYKKKKKKSPFILNYVMTWSLFGYVGSLVSFTEFSHILKNYHPLLNFVLTWSPFRYVGSLVSFTEFSHIFQKKKKKTKSPFELRDDLIPFWVCRQLGIIYWVQSHHQKKKKIHIWKSSLNYVLTWSPLRVCRCKHPISSSIIMHTFCACVPPMMN